MLSTLAVPHMILGCLVVANQVMISSTHVYVLLKFLVFVPVLFLIFILIVTEVQMKLNRGFQFIYFLGVVHSIYITIITLAAYRMSWKWHNELDLSIKLYRNKIHIFLS